MSDHAEWDEAKTCDVEVADWGDQYGEGHVGVAADADPWELNPEPAKRAVVLGGAGGGCLVVEGELSELRSFAERVLREVIVAEAAALGGALGAGAGSWVIDGNTSDERVRAIGKALDDGDPVADELYRAPLSGEYADDMVPRDVLVRLAADELYDDDDVAYDAIVDAFEAAHRDAFFAQVQRDVAARLGDDDDDDEAAEGCSCGMADYDAPGHDGHNGHNA